MTEFDIRELLEGFEENSIELREKEIVSADKIKEDVMNRIDKTTKKRIRKWTSASVVAAICAVALAGTALAVGLLQLDERRGDVYAPETSPAMEGYVAVTPSAEPSEEIAHSEVNAIGVTDSPEYLAAQEWIDWRRTHMEDNVLIPDRIENYTPEEIDAVIEAIKNDAYVRMGAYTEEAREVLDSIAAKYGLRVPDSFREVHPKDLYDMTGKTDILPWEVSAGTGILYEGGYLSVTNSAALKNGKTINYCLIRSVRGMFSEPTNFVMDPETLDEWQYTTADGTTVTLDLCASRSVLMVELPNSFVYVAIRGGTENNDETRDFTGPDTLTREDLEAFAELIDFKTLDSIQ